MRNKISDQRKLSRDWGRKGGSRAQGHFSIYSPPHSLITIVNTSMQMLWKFLSMLCKLSSLDRQIITGKS